VHKEPGFGFGKRLELILSSRLDKQPRSAHPDSDTNRDPDRRRTGEGAGIDGEDLRGRP
jgi:hypothetical protein